jgi:hypothetical protein
LPADKKVSLFWQLVFAYVPILNVWAFYRIRKLQKYFVLIIIPQFLLVAFTGLSTSQMVLIRYVNPPWGLIVLDPGIILSSQGQLACAMIGIFLQGFTTC